MSRIEEAAKRIRDNQYFYAPSETMFCFSRERMNDVCLLADAYLAEHTWPPAAALAAPPDAEDWKAKYEAEERDHVATIRDRDWMSDLLRDITLTITGETDIYGDPAIAYQTAADELPRILQAVRCNESGDEGTGELPDVSAVEKSDGGADEVSVVDQLRSEVERLTANYPGGDQDAQARSWSAVWRELEHVGMLSFPEIGGSGRDRAIAFIRHLARLADGREGDADELVKWIVNDIGELGVQVAGRCLFLYKGRCLEYGEGAHDDGTPMLFRRVGKREFGEVQHPKKWVESGRSEDHYAVELAPAIGVTLKDDHEYEWRPIPIHLKRT